jgi:signal transduction histidine kinase
MTLPIVVGGALLLAAGSYGAWRVHRLGQRGTDIVSENVASMRAAEKFETVIREIRYRLKRYLSTENDRHLDHIAGLLPEAEHWLEQADRLGKTQREQQLIAEIQQGLTATQQVFDEQLQASRGANTGDANELEQVADEVIHQRVLPPVQEYIALNQQEADRSSRRNRSTANELMFGLLVGTCGGVAGLLAGYLIARRVSRTIIQLSFPLRDVAGKLDEIVGPVAVAADPGLRDLEQVLQLVSQRITTVVERLQESERETLRAEQLAAVGQLAAGMAHELRNPLTSIKAIIQLADEPHGVTPRDREVVQEEIGRLEKSIQTFLDFSRPPHLEPRRLELGSLVQQTIDLVSYRAERQHIELRYAAALEPVPVVADAGQIRQVVLNLVLNAFEAVGRGGTVWVEVVATPQPDPQPEFAAAEASLHRAQIRVVDNGPGLPQELGQRIFEPFFSTKETGVGLGLSICRRIVEAHDGEIEVSPRPQGGCVFLVTLPAEPASPSSDGPVVAAEAGSPRSLERRSAVD